MIYYYDCLFKILGCHTSIQRRPLEKKVIRRKKHTHYYQPVREGNQAFPVFGGLKNSSPEDKNPNTIIEENLDILGNNEEQESFQKVLKK